MKYLKRFEGVGDKYAEKRFDIPMEFSDFDKKYNRDKLKDKEDIVKVILFNAIFGNKDDHSKNFSFLMNSKGKWSFAPAYDLTYTSNGYHQMLLGNKVLNRALFEDLKNAFEPYNIKESFLKENIEKMIDIKHKKLVQEFINYDIPKNLANHILNETKIVDDNFGKEIKK